MHGHAKFLSDHSFLSFCHRLTAARSSLSRYSFPLIEGISFSLSFVLLSRSSLWILPLIFFNIFLQGCLSEVGVVSDALYVGGGHGGLREHTGPRGSEAGAAREHGSTVAR
jgi:hypothetical protein